MSDLVRAFEAAGPADLEAVRASIAGHRQAIETLTALEKVLAVRLNGTVSAAGGTTAAEKKSPPPPVAPVRNGRAASKTSDPKDADLTKREKIVAYLLEHGPKPKAVVADKCGIGTRGVGSIGTVLAGCDWFHTNPDGIVSLTEKGERDNPLLRKED